MEYSIWHQIVTIWSTPPGAFLVSYGVLQDQLHMTIYIAIWSTPYGHFLMPYGVLHAVTFRCHMEYSMWSLFPAIWSASYYCHPCQLWKKCNELHKTCFQCSMEYSIWHHKTALLSTPYGIIKQSYGVLHITMTI